MRTGREVIEAIDDALILRERNGHVIWARCAARGLDVQAFRYAYSLAQQGVNTWAWFDGVAPRVRHRRRARGKAQRAARKVNR